MSKTPGWGRAEPELRPILTNASNVDKCLKCSQMSQILTNVWSWEDFCQIDKLHNAHTHNRSVSEELWLILAKPDGKDAVWGIEPQFVGVQAGHQCTPQHLTWDHKFSITHHRSASASVLGWHHSAIQHHPASSSMRVDTWVEPKGRLASASGRS